MKKLGWAFFYLSMWPAFILGCASQQFPQSSLTGKFIKVVIEESLPPDSVTVKRGDEIYWLNATTTTVDLWFVESLDGIISCQRNFASPGWGYLFGGLDREALVVATIPPEGTASLCFSTPGTYTYQVRLKDIPEGKAKMDGSVTIKQ